MSEQKIKELIEEMLKRTGPVLPLNRFNDFPELPAPQSMRNRMSEGLIPKDFFYKNGRTTLVDMREYIPFWVDGLKPYKQTGQVAR